MKGRFFEDYCNWEQIKEFEDCIFNSPSGADYSCQSYTNSKSTTNFS